MLTDRETPPADSDALMSESVVSLRRGVGGLRRVAEWGGSSGTGLLGGGAATLPRLFLLDNVSEGGLGGGRLRVPPREGTGGLSKGDAGGLSVRGGSEGGETATGLGGDLEGTSSTGEVLEELRAAIFCLRELSSDITEEAGGEKG